MPLNTNAAFKEESRNRATQPIFLYTIFDYDGAGANKYFAAYDTDVVFDSITYLRFPITHDRISENAKGEIDSTKVQLSNVARLIEYYLQNYDLRGKKISIRQVFANLLDDPDAYIEFSNYIDSYSSNVKDVVFNIAGKFDIMNVTVPSRIYIKSHCQWVFKSTECGYAGAVTTCNRTRGACKAMANQVRFGAFPSAPGGTSYA
jgi:lambda family phage minor tail protein L